MPVVFVHGVNVRESAAYEANVAERNLRIQELLLRPLLPNPAAVRFFTPYWGRFAASLAWDGASLPNGAAPALGSRSIFYAEQPLVEQLLSGSDISLPDDPNRTVLTVAQASFADAVDLLFALAGNQISVESNPADLTSLLRLSAAVYDYVDQNPRPAWLAMMQNDQEFITRLRTEVEQRLPPTPAASPQIGLSETPVPQALGFPDSWESVQEGLNRFGNLAGNLSSRALLAFTRKPLNDAVSHFIGDVFVYLDERGDQSAPGPIVREIAEKLDQATAAIDPQHDPYLIVIAHSMGGNITYDLLTYFRSNSRPVDLLITVGSQVALFEELKLYKASQRNIPSDPHQQRVAKPASVKHWLNVYDPNDILSYTVGGVFADASDFVYSTGKSVIAAHTAYFLRGSFYHRLAVRVKEILQSV